MSRSVRIAATIIVCIVAAIAVSLLSEKYVTHPLSNCARYNQLDGGVCPTHTAGWPFQSVFVYPDGSTKPMKTDSSGWCIGGCDTKSIGSQTLYNAAIISLIFLAIATIGSKVVTKLR